MNNPFNFFNLSDFKKWIKNHDDNNQEKESFIGKRIKPKSNIENFEEKIQVEIGDEKEIVEDFGKIGGKIIEQDVNKFMIEVKSGNFICHKRFLKKIN